MTRCVGALGLVTSMWSIPAYAHPFPFETDDAGTIGAGRAELALAGSAEAGESLTVDGVLGAHLGVLPTVDVGVTAAIEAQRDDGARWTSGFADTVLDLKWRLASTDDEAFAFAVRIDYAPRQDGPMSSGAHDVGAIALASWQLDTLGVHLDLGAHAPIDSEQGGAVTLMLGAGLMFDMASALQLGIEAFGELSTLDGSGAARGLIGVLWQAGDAHVITIGVGPRWNSTSPSRIDFVATGVLTITLGS
jgi:hypothetical protein